MVYHEFENKLQQAYKIQEINERRLSIQKINEEFEIALHTEYLSNQNELVASKVYEYAWIHSNGYIEVETYYNNISELVEFAIKNA